MFRADLAAPWGSEGAISKLDNFSNLVYTALFDPTNLTTPGGRAFMHALGGAAGDEIVDDYVRARYRRRAARRSIAPRPGAGRRCSARAARPATRQTRARSSAR
ncbi:MAG: hypothetical protein H0X44_07215 [Acidobacteria bacterium]|nr:hypothetical protein [Acidobacteriota bacterium]